MATFTNPDSVHRASPGAVAPASWGDTVNDDINFLYGDTAWTQVTSFTNGWVQNTESVQYRKIGTRVWVRGGISGGTASAAAFTLPTGYTPTTTYTFICWDGTTSTAKFVQVGNTGNVTPGVASDLLYLDAISFDTV